MLFNPRFILMMNEGNSSIIVDEMRRKKYVWNVRSNSYFSLNSRNTRTGFCFTLLRLVLLSYRLSPTDKLTAYSFKRKIVLQLELIIGPKGGNQWFSIFGQSLLVGSLRQDRLSLEDRFLLLAFLLRMLNSCRTSGILNNFIRINMIRQFIIYLRT